MLTDRWEIAHLAYAVNDVDAAMKTYGPAFGVKVWGPNFEFPVGGENHLQLASPNHGDRISFDGLTEIFGRTSQKPVAGGPSFAPISLIHAAKFSPAYTLFGCPNGQDYLHHVCFYVEDLAAEAAHLMANGYKLDATMAPGNPVKAFAWLTAPNFGPRIELWPLDVKEANDKGFSSGDMDIVKHLS